MIECDAVFEGGGVKGIALAGAAAAMENGGYTFGNVAGSSAGAIIASLLAAGYNTAELYEVMRKVDYEKLRQKDILDHFGLPGKLLSLCISYGIYNTDYLESWLEGLLAAKGVRVFGDLPSDEDGPYVFGKNKCRLRLTVSDLSLGRLLVLPDGLDALGISPENFSVAAAVRMSASIPLYYEPYRLTDKNGKKHYMVDGGMLSNYPVWILDKGKLPPPRPVFGFRFIDEDINSVSVECEGCKPVSIIEYVKAIVSTMTDARDKQYARFASGDEERTVMIPTVIRQGKKYVEIKATDFGLTPAQSEALYNNGLTAGRRFLKTWNFESWKTKYR